MATGICHRSPELHAAPLQPVQSSQVIGLRGCDAALCFHLGLAEFCFKVAGNGRASLLRSERTLRTFIYNLDSLLEFSTEGRADLDRLKPAPNSHQSTHQWRTEVHLHRADEKALNIWRLKHMQILWHVQNDLVDALLAESCQTDVLTLLEELHAAVEAQGPEILESWSANLNLKFGLALLGLERREEAKVHFHEVARSAGADQKDHVIARLMCVALGGNYRCFSHR